MTVRDRVLASGNLASSRRTLMGILGQLSLLEMGEQENLSMITRAGLPARALAEPDFPISLQQDLYLTGYLVDGYGAQQSPVRLMFSILEYLGIEQLGVLGMVMRHAGTVLDAVDISLRYPQLSWGHSRLLVREGQGKTLFAFAMERPQLSGTSPAQVDRLMEHCLLLDLLSTQRALQDILQPDEVPESICLPFAEPADWARREGDLPCPVRFQQEEALLVYRDDFHREVPARASEHLFRSYAAVAERLSLMLAEDVSLSERVVRWLWAYTPPLKRGEVATQLALSERSLTRQLAKEGTSYAQLLAGVQEERAKNFLRNPAWSVAETGYRLGYSEPAAFTRAFTGWTGVSPLRWRQSQREDRAE